MKTKYLPGVVLFFLLALFSTAATQLMALTEQEFREGFRPLFDAKSLSDWDGDMRSGALKTA